MTAGPLQITAEEVNCLIYSYFQDSGLSHSAFSILHEGQLQRSPYLAKHIPRGELIQLLGKALLYLEVESHWRGDHLTNNCQSGFSLLEPHVCSSTPKHTFADVPLQPQAFNNGAKTSVSALSAPTMSRVPQQQTTAQQTVATPTPSISEANKATSASVDLTNKRKVSPTPSSGPTEKRPRIDPDQMEVDSQVEVKPKPGALDVKLSAKKGRWSPRDDKTDSRAVIQLQGHATEVFVCAWNPVYYETLASGSKDAVLNLWKLPKPPQRADSFATAAPPLIAMTNLSKHRQADLTALHWSPNGEYLAIGSYDATLRICQRNGTMWYTNTLHDGPLFAVRFSKNGRWVVTASLDGTSAVWDVNERKEHKQYRVHVDCCLDVYWLTDETFASAGADKRICIMNIFHDEPIRVLEGHEDEINQIRSNPAGTRLASCSDDFTARIWTVDAVSTPVDDEIPGLTSSDSVVILEGHTHSVSTVVWCPKRVPGSNELIATCSFDHTARLWDSVTGKCLQVFADHARPVYAMTFSPNGEFLATGAGDGWIYVYSMKTYERAWGWYAGIDKPGVFEIDWQIQDGVNRIALALENRTVAVIDVSKISALDTIEYRHGLEAIQSGQ